MHLAAERGRAGHRDTLALAARERLDGLADVLDGQQPEVGEQPLGVAAACPGVEHPEHRPEDARPAPFAAEEHVGGDVQRGAHREALVHGLDARRARLQGARKCTGWPSSRISPASGMTAPQRHLMSVDLPAPLSPMTPSTSPGSSSKSAVVERHHPAVGSHQAARLEHRAGLSGCPGRSRPSADLAHPPIPDPLVQRHGDDDQDPDGEVLPEGIHAGDGQPVPGSAHDERPEERAQMLPRPPNRLVPPMTTAVMVSRLAPCPACGLAA